MSRCVLLLFASLGALRDPGCGTDTSAGGPNAPCTRPSDCESRLSCVRGVCASPDAGDSDGGGDASGRVDATASD